MKHYHKRREEENLHVKFSSITIVACPSKWWITKYLRISMAFVSRKHDSVVSIIGRAWRRSNSTKANVAFQVQHCFHYFQKDNDEFLQICMIYILHWSMYIYNNTQEIRYAKRKGKDRNSSSNELNLCIECCRKQLINN